MTFQESTLIEIAFSSVIVRSKCQSAKIHITVVHDCANQKNPVRAKLTYRAALLV